MKKYFKLLLVLFVMFSIVSFNDIKAMSYGNYTYEILDNGTIEITGYIGKEANITIPSVVNGKTVTRIGEDAFMFCKFKTIKIPSSVTQIGSGAFTASSITTITIPNSVKKIADHTFFDCTYLTNVSIPNSVTSIGEFAFAGCENLLNIIIPKSVVNIGEGAFKQNWITPNKITINVYEGSYAEEYAKKNITDHESSFLYKIIKTSVTKLKVTVKNATYTGKAIKQKITLKDGKKVLKNGKDYTLSYKNNKNTGKATITIKGKGNYTGSKTINFYIVPKKITISSVKSGKKQLTVKYKKVTGASGYQIAYSTSKSKGFKYITVNSKTASKVIKKLKSKKKYYVKVRAYKTVGKKKYYGAYSAIKSVKVK